jgi:hypothetical protein
MQVANLTPRASGLEPVMAAVVIDLDDDPQAAIISAQQLTAAVVTRPWLVDVSRKLRQVIPRDG